MNVETIQGKIRLNERRDILMEMFGCGKFTKISVECFIFVSLKVVTVCFYKLDCPSFI